MKTTLTLGILLACIVNATAQIHVAPNGDDASDGSAAKPVATVAQALKLADEKGGEQTILLHAGIYRERVEIPVREGAQPLTIAAARTADGAFERVVFDLGYTVDNVEPVEGLPGVYRVPIPAGFNAYRCRRAMWETDTRRRYRRVADARSVAAFPASFRFETEGYASAVGWLTFHTSDDRPPASHEIGFSFGDGGGFTILRDNVTIQGLDFRNVGDRALAVSGADTLIEDCSAWNVERMVVYISAACPRATVRRLNATDVGAGVYSEGGHTVVEECRLFRAHDGFESHARTQEDTAGIQLYSPAKTGELRGNLTVGFRLGIFCKKGEGAVTIENNTTYGGPNGGADAGISFVHWFEDCVIRNNIVSGHYAAYDVSVFTRRTRNAVFRDNLLWDVEHRENIHQCLTVPQSTGSGQGVIVADPRFAAPALGDFRLQTDSPVPREDGPRIGAFGRVDAGWKDTEPPTVSLRLADPARVLGRTVEHFLERDHWSEGGGVREERGTTFENEEGNQWIVPAAEFTLDPAVADNASAVTQMKLRIDDGPWSEATEFAWSKTLAFAEGSLESAIAVKVADVAGNWSEPATLHLFRADAAPRLAGAPHTYATRNGLVVAFKTDTPCTARLEWGTGEELDRVAERAPDVYRDWDAEYGETIEVRTGPRLDHVLAIQAPAIEPRVSLRYRVVLDDGLGHVHHGEIVHAELSGEPRELVIDPAGRDREGDGPWRTLQFAVDRALPGDRVVLRDGLYAGLTTVRRGGIAGAPLIIEAEHSGRATLDAGKLHRHVIRMNETPHVTLSGIEVRWFHRRGIQITESSHVTLENMTFWNENLIKGRRQGGGFYARHSPHLSVRGCLFFYMNEGFCILDSPGFHFEGNTVGTQVHRGCRIIFSTRGSTLINNCFAFTGNEHLAIYERREDWETFTCDYNNYPAHLRPIAKRRPPPEEDIKHPGAWAKTAKRVHYVGFRKPGGWDRFACYSLGEWQEVSGKDVHSIFKHPRFVAPTEKDWRLQPDSPNIGAGKDGVTIGVRGEDR